MTVERYSRAIGAAGSGPRPVLRAAYLTVRVVGWVVIVLGLNYGLGWLWDEYVGSHDQAPAAATPADAVDRWAAAPAMASEPWADGYWDEFRALDYEFDPYLLSRVVEVEGRYINAAGPERRSYVPSGLGPAAPEVWFLGGAALWGQGQRDLHTVPSEVARLAEAAICHEMVALPNECRTYLPQNPASRPPV